MTQIESIIALMRNDLNTRQLSKLQTVLETILKVRHAPPPLSDLIRRFESSKRIMGIKDTTIAQYSMEISILAKNVSKPVHLLTASDIKDYLARYKEMRQISTVTVQNKLRFLSSFFEYLLDEGYIDRNPIRGIGRILVEKRIKKSFSPDDLSRIRASCSSARDRALVEFLYSTGCRVSECTALKVRDLDIRMDELIVFGKGHKERVVYLNRSAKEYLQIYLRLRRPAPEDALFSRHD